MAHILIVEDDPTNAELARIVCEDAGHTTRLAYDGKVGLKALLAKEAFDLILLDVLMPEMDGIAFAMALKASTSYASLPLIAVTGVSGPRDTEKLLNAGMDDVITKPYRPEALRAAIERVLGRG